jgi:predicted O-methyltransferase YrrM
MSTHMLTLMRALKETTGDVCEVGAGFYSTALIHWLCSDRNIVTYESDPDYFHYASKFKTTNHRVRKTEDFSDMDFERHWSVVFIDHTSDRSKNPHTRGEDALKFKNADIIVMHDTEPENEAQYGYPLVWPHFKYRYNWTQNKPHCSAVSNVIDVTKWNSQS